MNADTRGCLERISRVLAEQVGPRKYKVWFKNSTRLRLDGEHLQVAVPNQFIGAWIEKHFVGDISQAAGRVLGAAVQVHTLIDPSLFANLARGQLDSQASDVTHQAERLSRPQVGLNGNGNGNGNGHCAARWPTAAGAGSDGDGRFRLEDFVVGDCNRLAYNCAMEVVESPGSRYNPLFIHGGCGLGKSHLLHGIGLALSRGRKRWLYVPAEEFTNQFLWAMRTQKLDRFRARFRNVEVLLVDDVHFLSDKKATQTEFLHTFNEISSGGRQVVMASDSHPKLIGLLAEPLVNRFISGMVAKIDKPDPETRRQILRRRAQNLRLQLSEEVIAYVADRVQDNVRELEGVLLKLLAYRSVSRAEVDMEAVRGLICEHVQTVAPAVRLSDIELQVATYFGVRPIDLHSSRKNRTVSAARAVAMYLARRMTRLSFPDIGKYMGNKNHATVIQACRRIEQRVADDMALEWMIGDESTTRPAKKVISELESELSRKC